MSLLPLLLGLLFTSVGLWFVGRWLRRRHQRGPAKLHQQLVSWEFGLTGKPDLILQQNGTTIPVLVKKGQAHTAPHESHLAQILAYCLLVQETIGHPPPYGIIRYDNRTFEVDYDEEAYHMLLDVLAEMHEQRAHFGLKLPRSHSIDQRCYACRHHKNCDQSLIS
jgi:CRISPR-associated exonuclease Cas4